MNKLVIVRNKRGKQMKTEEDYMDLCNEIKAAADKAGLEYMVDHAIHAEDAKPAYGQDNYYDLMYDCAINFAVTRLEEVFECEGQYNISLNDLLGRIVY
tara:strand:+ start:147 stop:443 length:297 start_codon:yes stop_codon:yes gene_type:complete